jgi:hypothetical protein
MSIIDIFYLNSTDRIVATRACVKPIRKMFFSVVSVRSVYPARPIKYLYVASGVYQKDGNNDLIKHSIRGLRMIFPWFISDFAQAVPLQQYWLRKTNHCQDPFLICLVSPVTDTLSPIVGPYLTRRREGMPISSPCRIVNSFLPCQPISRR